MYIQGSILVSLAILAAALIQKASKYTSYLGTMPKDELIQRNRDKNILVIFLILAVLMMAFLRFKK